MQHPSRRAVRAPATSTHGALLEDGSPTRAGPADRGAATLGHGRMRRGALPETSMSLVIHRGVLSARGLFLAAAMLLALPGAATAATVTVVEYYNAALDHYFITPLADEIDALDSGRIAGWGRTGLVFDGVRSPGRRRRRGQPGVPLLHPAAARRLAFLVRVARRMRRGAARRSRPIRTSAATSRRRPRSSTSRCRTPSPARARRAPCPSTGCGTSAPTRITATRPIAATATR